MTTNLYDMYKRLRKEYGMDAEQAHRVARNRIAHAVTLKLLGADHPLNMALPTPGDVYDFHVDGYECSVKVDHDDMCTDDEWMGFSVNINRHEFYESGWGRAGMDEGEYTADSYARVLFNETRPEIMQWAPAGMSRQMKYEWATEIMRNKAERYNEWKSSERFEVFIRVECDDIDFSESLGGLEQSLSARDDEYLHEVFEEMYYQLKEEIDRQKKVA